MLLTKCTHEMSSTEIECSEKITEKSKIAVIIPIYNSEKYLKDCLFSVSEQSLKEIEIICIDDGSTDNSVSIISEFFEQDGRIRCIRIEHSGPGVARNIGIDASNSEFIAFMDSDDMYPNTGTLKKLYSEAKRNDVQICGGSWSEKKEDTVLTSFQDSGYVFKDDGITCYREYQFDFGYHRFIYATELISRCGIRFPNLLRYQDPPFFVSAMYHAGRFYSLFEPTYCKRIKNENALSTKDKILDFLQGIRMVFDFADEHELHELMDTTTKRLAENILAITESVVLSELNSISTSLVELYSRVCRHSVHHQRLPSPAPVIAADICSDKTVISTFMSLWRDGHCKLFPDKKMIYPIFNAIKKYGMRYCLRHAFNVFLKIIQ